MSTTFKRPPSQRNFQVHYFLREGGSTREAAARFGISQTRVRQLERQVLSWAAEVLPVESEAEVAGLVRVAESVAADRLEHFYQETMAQWRREHQPKFLNLAIRVTMASVRLPCRSYEIDAAAADLLEGPEEEGDQESGARNQEPEVRGPRPTAAALTEAAAPSDRACSPPQPTSASHSPPVVVRRDASRPAPGKLGLLLEQSPSTQDEIAARARTLLTPPSREQIAQLGMAPAELGLNVDEFLQRSARRKRKAK